MSRRLILLNRRLKMVYSIAALEGFFIDAEELNEIKREILDGMSRKDLKVGTGTNSNGEVIVYIYIGHPDLHSAYQGRLYTETYGQLDELFESDMSIKPDKLWEIVSENLPHYMAGEKAPNRTIQSIYELIRKAMG